MKVKRFNESNLNLEILDKTSKDGESRGQKLVNRLAGDQDFTIAIKGKGEKQVNFKNAEDVVDDITINNNYDKGKSSRFFKQGTRFKPVLQGEDDVNYKLNDIKKDEYFGSSSGSSLGFQKTRLMESIQCIFLSLKQHLIKVPSLKHFHLEFLYDSEDNLDPEIMKYVKIPIDIDAEFLRNFINDNKEGWVETFINTANALYLEDLQLVGKDKRTVFEKGKKYNFHQIGADTDLMNALSRSFNRSNVTKESPMSKWNPADIWVSDSMVEPTIVARLNGANTIVKLNRLINSQFLRSQLVGVSLKKIGNAESIKLVINKLTPPPTYRFDSIITSNSPFGSLGVKLVANFKSEVLRDGQDTMYIRSFGGSNNYSNVSGEVEGQHSRYGKIGLEWINKILLKNGILVDDIIPTKDMILKNASYTEEFLKSEIQRMNKFIPDKQNPRQKNIEGMPSLISKYQALKFGVLMVELSKVDEDEGRLSGETTQMLDKITQEILYYAMSIKNYNFDCPMYVRIVSNKS
jgi:hypothetical protein